MKDTLVVGFAHAAQSPEPDLAVAALMIARVEYPSLDAGPYLDQLDALGAAARARVLAVRAGEDATPDGLDPETHGQVLALNRFLFDEMGFSGNHERYDDPRNSCLNQVIDRRIGIPISLAVVYLEVARRAGVAAEGINFPGHFLVRCPAPGGRAVSRDILVDAYHGGALLSPEACLALLRRHNGDEAELEASVFRRATKPQILTRMLVNLKRLYVRMHSLPQARRVVDLLLAIDSDRVDEWRDRGLMAYHLGDFSSALRDLEHYLRLARQPSGHPVEEERERVWEHVKALRRRVASLN